MVTGFIAYPVGGLGIRQLCHLSSSAFLSSVSRSMHLIQVLLPSSGCDHPVPFFDEALTVWQELSDAPPPPLSVSHFQRAWDSPVVDHFYDLLLSNLDQRNWARLLGVSSKEAGGWLTTFPIASVGLRMEQEVFRTAIGLRLGLPVCSPHKCRNCGSDVDELGLHGLSCRSGRGRLIRHNAVNEVVKRSLDGIKIPSSLEPSGIHRSDKKRPDGVTMVPWRCGKLMIWDVTCPDSLAPSYVRIANKYTGAVADEAERKKRVKYLSLVGRYLFTPIGIETLGSFGKQATSFLKLLSKRCRYLVPDGFSYSSIVQQISVAVQSGNAISILETI